MEKINGKGPKPTEFRNLTKEQQEDAVKFGYDGSFKTSPTMAEGNLFVKEAVLNAEFQCKGCGNHMSGSKFVLFGLDAIYRLINRRCIEIVKDQEPKGPKILIPGDKS